MNPTIKTTPKDFFLHLGALIALFVSVGAILNLLFNVINYSFPDALASYYYSSSIAWPISMLIVLIPLLYVLEWLIHRDMNIIPEKSELWIRRWRVYLTIFITGAVVVGDIVTLIYTFINGEITERFTYKFISVLIVFAIVFIYFIVEKTSKSKTVRTVLSVIGIIIVIASIVWGFVIVGSPKKQRALRFDSQRVSDLSNIQWQIIRHWQANGKIPEKLLDLNDSISYYNIPTDPEDKTKQYEYIVKGEKDFSLCANFSLKSEDNKGRGTSYTSKMLYDGYGYGYDNGSWEHGAGRVCFEKTIDSNIYPVNPKTEQNNK